MRVQINDQATKLVAALKKRPFLIEEFSKLLPDDDEAEGFTTDDGYNLYHAFFQQLVRDSAALRNLNQETVAPIMLAMMQGVRAGFFFEATLGNYTSQPLHYLVAAENVNPAVCVFNWLIEAQEWVLLAGSGKCYPPVLYFYYQRNPGFCLGFTEKDELKVLPSDVACDLAEALDHFLHLGGASPSLVPISIMMHLACFGWDGTGKIGSYLWNETLLTAVRSRSNFEASYFPMDEAGLRSNFPKITEHDFPAFLALAQALPKLQRRDNEEAVINIVVRDYLLEKWQEEAPKAHDNLYFLVKKYLLLGKDGRDTEYEICESDCIQNEIFIYAYMIAYGSLINVSEDFFKNVEYLLSIDVSKKIHAEETFLTILTRLLITRPNYNYEVKKLCEILKKAACSCSDQTSLEQIENYQKLQEGRLRQELLMLKKEMLVRVEAISAQRKQVMLENLQNLIGRGEVSDFPKILKEAKLNQAELEDLLLLAAKIDTKQKLRKSFLKSIFVALAELDPALAINKLLAVELGFKEELLQVDGVYVKRNPADQCDDSMLIKALKPYVDPFTFREIDEVKYAIFSVGAHYYGVPKAKKKTVEPVKSASAASLSAAPAPRAIKPAESVESKKPKLAQEPKISKEVQELLNQVIRNFKKNYNSQALDSVRQLVGMELSQINGQKLLIAEQQYKCLTEQANALSRGLGELVAFQRAVYFAELELRKQWNLSKNKKEIPLEYQPRHWVIECVPDLDSLESVIREKSASADAELALARAHLQKLRQVELEKLEQYCDKLQQEWETQAQENEILVASKLEKLDMIFVEPPKELLLGAAIEDAQTQAENLEEQLRVLTELSKIGPAAIQKLIETEKFEQAKLREELRKIWGEKIPESGPTISATDFIASHRKLSDLISAAQSKAKIQYDQVSVYLRDLRQKKQRVMRFRKPKPPSNPEITELQRCCLNRLEQICSGLSEKWQREVEGNSVGLQLCCLEDVKLLGPVKNLATAESRVLELKSFVQNLEGLIRYCVERIAVLEQESATIILHVKSKLEEVGIRGRRFLLNGISAENIIGYYQELGKRMGDLRDMKLSELKNEEEKLEKFRMLEEYKMLLTQAKRCVVSINAKVNEFGNGQAAKYDEIDTVSEEFQRCRVRMAELVKRGVPLSSELLMDLDKLPGSGWKGFGLFDAPQWLQPLDVPTVAP